LIFGLFNDTEIDPAKDPLRRILEGHHR